MKRSWTRDPIADHPGTDAAGNWRRLAAEVRRGTSVGRALMHLQVQADVAVRGIVLDVGGGHRQTYLGFLDPAAMDRFISMDIQPTPNVDVVGSVGSMPFSTGSFDTVLCFNLLEHVFDHETSLRELRRVMKPDAVLYGWTPFSIGVHGDPCDYWRYTPDALEALLRKTGFAPVRVTGCGDAFLSAFDLVRPYIRARFVGRMLRVAGVVLASLAGWTWARIRPVANRTPVPADCPNGVWFVARRGGWP